MTDTPWSERVRLWAHNLDRSDDTRPTVPFTLALQSWAESYGAREVRAERQRPVLRVVR